MPLFYYVLVDEAGLAPASYKFRLSFLHTYSAFELNLVSPTDGGRKAHAVKILLPAHGRTREKVYRLINAESFPTVKKPRRTALSYAAQATPAALKEGKAITLESFDSAFKFKFPFLQSRAFGMLFSFSARNRI